MSGTHLISIDSLMFVTGTGLIAYYIYLSYFSAQNSSMANGSSNLDSNPSFMKKSSNLLMSAKERLEVSWKFLYEITETVINKFSNQDKQELIDNGSTLFNAGMRYEHVIDYAINQESQKIYEKKLDASKELENASQTQSR